MNIVRRHLSLGLFAAALVAAQPAHAALTGDRLLSGNTSADAAALVAGTRGATYELRGGATVAFSPDAEFTFEPSMRVKIRKPGDPETLARVVLMVRGRAEVTIPANLKEPTAVYFRASGKMSAIAKEGRSTFIVDGAQTTAASREGELLVGIGDFWKPLHAGLARTLAPDDPTAVTHPILDTPVVTASPAVVLSQRGEPAHAAMSWSPVKDAIRYEVAVTEDVGGATSPVSEVSTSTPTASLGDLAPGAYSASVVAIDRRGLTGTPSAPRILHVVGVNPPEGSELGTDGAILLGRDQRVTLVAAEGLRVSYGASSESAGAPSTLGLAHGEPVTARLRAPGSSQEAVMRLEPRGLRANVQIGPRLARWPLDPVVIRINLYDASGRPVPKDAVVEPRVTVNLATVTPKWERVGTTLRATLSSGATPGPWVVRAEVRDPEGELIGRDFLEVAESDSRGASAVAKR